MDKNVMYKSFRLSCFLFFFLGNFVFGETKKDSITLGLGGPVSSADSSELDHASEDSLPEALKVAGTLGTDSRDESANDLQELKTAGLSLQEESEHSRQALWKLQTEIALLRDELEKSQKNPEGESGYYDTVAIIIVILLATVIFCGVAFLLWLPAKEKITKSLEQFKSTIKKVESKHEEMCDILGRRKRKTGEALSGIQSTVEKLNSDEIEWRNYFNAQLDDIKGILRQEGTPPQSENMSVPPRTASIEPEVQNDESNVFVPVSSVSECEPEPVESDEEIIVSTYFFLEEKRAMEAPGSSVSLTEFQEEVSAKLPGRNVRISEIYNNDPRGRTWSLEHTRGGEPFWLIQCNDVLFFMPKPVEGNFSSRVGFESIPEQGQGKVRSLRLGKLKSKNDCFKLSESGIIRYA